MRIRIWPRRSGVPALIAASAALAIAALALVFPATAAAACPACFGFVPLEGSIFVDDGMPSEVRRQTEQIVEHARQRVEAFYGGRAGAPDILVCSNEACYDRLHGGRSRGMALSTFALVLSPRGASETIAAHELSHIELHSRIGAWRAYRGAIPAWFDEGLAVVVSDDARYLTRDDGGDRCRVVSDEPLPLTRRNWVRRADDRLYAVAACRVSRWMASHGGRDGLARLVRQIADGADFATALQ